MSAEANTEASGNPVIDHLDLWSSVTVKKAATGRGRNGKVRAYGIQKLREMILELAVRGKLVPQDSDDEPTSVLLEKIAKEKVRLIIEKKTKKQKALLEIAETEKLFELPRGWEWVRLGGVTEFINGYAFKSTDFVHEGIGIVKIGDIWKVRWSRIRCREFKIKLQIILMLTCVFQKEIWLLPCRELQQESLVLMKTKRCFT